MLIAANRKNLKQHARALLGNEYSPETEKALIAECCNGFTIEPYCHISHGQAAHLNRIGKILGTYGTEGLLLDSKGNDCAGDCCTHNVCHDVQYCNAGDTYAMTVLYYNGKLKIGDWGSIVERC